MKKWEKSTRRILDSGGASLVEIKTQQRFPSLMDWQASNNKTIQTQNNNNVRTVQNTFKGRTPVRFPNCHECPEASGLGNLALEAKPCLHIQYCFLVIIRGKTIIICWFLVLEIFSFHAVELGINIWTNIQSACLLVPWEAKVGADSGELGGRASGKSPLSCRLHRSPHFANGRSFSKLLKAEIGN